MGSTSISLKRSDDLLPQVESILPLLFQRVLAVLPDAECHHIGATAIPGAVTKGDIDILVRMSPVRFKASSRILGVHFEVKQAKNWTSSFASFGDDVSYGIQTGIQLVARDSESDFLVYLRDYLIEHPEALEAYNRIKIANAPLGPDCYWKEKDKFFTRLLTPWNKANGFSL